MVGGHFFCMNTMTQTLRSISVEHFAGTLVTNATHETACVLVYKILLNYLMELEESSKAKEGSSLASVERYSESTPVCA